MAYDPDQDPFATPQDSGTQFFQWPFRKEVAEVSEVEFIMNESNQLEGVTIELAYPQFSAQTQFNTIKQWYKPLTSAFVRGLFTHALEMIGVPSVTLSQVDVDGNQRKSFANSMIDKMTGQYTGANIVGKKVITDIKVQFKCPCGAYTDLAPDYTGICKKCQTIFDSTNKDHKAYAKVDSADMYQLQQPATNVAQPTAQTAMPQAPAPQGTSESPTVSEPAQAVPGAPTAIDNAVNILSGEGQSATPSVGDDDLPF